MKRTESVEHVGWGVPMATGVLMIVGGLFALLASVLTGLVSVIFLGALLAVVGVTEIVSAFRVRHGRSFGGLLVGGLLALVTGGLFLYRPFAGMASLTLLIASYMFGSGLFRGITSIVDRYPRWGLDLIYGILAIVLGGFVAASWPVSSLWVLGTVVGVEIIARGFAWVAASWKMREFEHATAHAA